MLDHLLKDNIQTLEYIDFQITELMEAKRTLKSKILKAKVIKGLNKILGRINPSVMGL